MTEQSDNTNPKIQKAEYISPTSWKYGNHIYEYINGGIITWITSDEPKVTMSQINHEDINDSAFERYLETDEAQQQIEEVARHSRQNKK